MKFEHTWTGNWENAFRGLRHPMESYDKADSRFCLTISPKEEDVVIRQYEDIYETIYIGPNDMNLAQRMIKAQTPNDKFLRQVFVSVDVTAPLYLFKELDTYKIGTVADSTSTMHKLSSTSIIKECFEMGDYSDINVMIDGFRIYSDEMWETLINELEALRQAYNQTKDIRFWKELIRLLPESWLQTRTWTANYSVLRNIFKWRKDHKLTEWHQFCDWIKTLPYAAELITLDLE